MNPNLFLPVWTEPIFLLNDASKIGGEAVLTPQIEGLSMVIALGR